MHSCMQQMHLYSEYTMQLVSLEAWRDVLTTQHQGNNASPLSQDPSHLFTVRKTILIPALNANDRLQTTVHPPLPLY
jgi:hypothetical protein